MRGHVRSKRSVWWCCRPRRGGIDRTINRSTDRPTVQQSCNELYEENGWDEVLAQLRNTLTNKAYYVHDLHLRTV